MKTKLAEKVNVVKKAQDILNSRIAICNANLQKVKIDDMKVGTPSLRAALDTAQSRPPGDM